MVARERPEHPEGPPPAIAARSNEKGHARRCAPGVPRHCFSLCLAPERPRKLLTSQELRERSQRGDSGYNETLDHLLSVVDGNARYSANAPVVRGLRRSESRSRLRSPV